MCKQTKDTGGLMMIKFIEVNEKALRGLSIQVDPKMYDRICEVTQKFDVTKKTLINTALVILLDRIEDEGCLK